MGETKEIPEKKIHYQKKNVFIGRNPDTGTPYFERKKVPIITPENSGDFQPTFDELPPTQKDSLQGTEVKYTKIKPKKKQPPLY